MAPLPDSAVRLPGIEWPLSLVGTDPEGRERDYRHAVGAADLCAAGVGAPHIRQRLFFGAVRAALGDDADGRCEVRGVADADGRNTEHGCVQRGREHRLRAEGRRAHGDETDAERAEAGDVADPGRQGLEGCDRPRLVELHGAAQPVRPAWAGGVVGSWTPCDWLPCRDGKARPVEPGTFPLAHGAPARVGRLRAYGNAIVPQVAAQFVAAFCASVAA